MTKRISLTVAAALACVMAVGCGPKFEVRSNPPGAKVLCDGKDTGRRTPCRFRANEFHAGKHVFTVEKEGYETVTPPQTVAIFVSTAKIVWSCAFPPVGLAFACGSNWKTLKPKYLAPFHMEKAGQVAERPPPDTVPGTAPGPTAETKPEPAPPDAKPATDEEAKIREKFALLERLRKAGILTEEEYKEKRRKVIEGL